MLCHNLDTMYIEKNVCDIVLVIVMNILNQTKDNIKACFDLQYMGLKKQLHLVKEGCL